MFCYTRVVRRHILPQLEAMCCGLKHPSTVGVRIQLHGVLRRAKHISGTQKARMVNVRDPPIRALYLQLHGDGNPTACVSTYPAKRTKKTDTRGTFTLAEVVPQYMV